MKNKIQFGFLSLCGLSFVSTASAQIVQGNIVIEDGKIRVVGVGINVPGVVVEGHGHHHHRPHHPPVYPTRPSPSEYLDPREAELILRSCGASYSNESQANCFADNLLRNPNPAFQRIGRATNAGVSYNDRALGAKAALNLVSRSASDSSLSLRAILAACTSMYSNDSQASCFNAGTSNSSESLTVIREGSNQGISYSDRALSFRNGIEKRLSGAGPITSLRAACSAAYSNESQSKCFEMGGRRLSDFQAKVLITAAMKGSSYNDRALGSKAGLLARIQNRPLAQQILATCSAMYSNESQSNCYASAANQMRGYDNMIDRLLSSCQRGNSYYDRAQCSENVLRNM